MGVGDAFRQVDYTLNDIDRQLRAIETDIKGSEEYVLEQINEVNKRIIEVMEISKEKFDEVYRRLKETNQTAVDVDWRVEDDVFGAASEMFWPILEKLEEENGGEFPSKDFLRLYFRTIESRLEMLEKAVYGGTIPDDSGD